MRVLPHMRKSSRIASRAGLSLPGGQRQASGRALTPGGSSRTVRRAAMPSRLLLVLATVLLVVGCSAKKPVVPPDTLWSDGNAAYNDEAYERAIARYKALLDQHPFDENAEEAELKIAQAQYLSQHYPEAIAAFGDFERMHPTSPNLPLVEYHLGLSYLAQASTNDRDQSAHTNA